MSRLPQSLPSSATDVTNFQDMWIVNEATLQKISDFLSQKDFLSKVVSLFSEPAASVNGVRIFPFEVPEGEDGDIIIGGVPAVEDGHGMKRPRPSTTLVDDIQFSFNVPMPDPLNFLHFEPFTTYALYVPFAGIVNVEARRILGRTITVKYAVDLHTGNATIYVNNDTENLYTTSTQIGINIPFGWTNEGQADVARCLGAIKTGLSMGFAGIPMTKTTTTSGQWQTSKGAVATGGKTVSTPTTTTSERYKVVFDKNFNEIPNAAESGKQSTTVRIRGGAAPPQAATLANGILNLANDKASYAGGVPGGDFSQFTIPLLPYLIITKTHIHDIEDYGKYFGYACAEKIKLGEHHGYCELSNIHMEGLPDTLEDECDAISAFLKTGVILP